MSGGAQLVSDVGKRIGEMFFFFFQRVVLLSNTQCHFGYLALQNRKLTLVQFVNIQAVSIMKHKIDLV